MDADHPEYGVLIPCRLTYMTFPKEHWTKIHSVNPLERLSGEIKRRTNVIGIFPDEEAVTRLVVWARRATGEPLRLHAGARAAT